MSVLRRLAFSALALLPCTSLVFAQACPGPDALEDDDDCATAIVVGSLPQTFTARSVHGAGSSSGVDDDVYRFSVPAGELLIVDWTYTLVDSDRIDAFLYDAATIASTCGDYVSVLASRYSSGSTNQLVWANASGASADVLLQLHAADAAPMFDCVEYELTIATTPDPCAAGLDDSLEENDDCASAAALGVGVQAGLLVSTTDRDFYRVSIPPQERVIVDVDHDPGYAALGVSIYDDANCAVELGVDAYTPRLTVSAGNTAATAQEFFVEVRNLGQSGCSPTYDLSVVLQPDDCQLTADDAFEPNDDCLSATSMSVGTHTGLFVRSADPDYYRVTVAPGDELVVDISKPAGMRELELHLYDDASCSNEVDFVYTDWPSSDVSISNGSGAPKDYYLGVFVNRFQPGIGDCSDYELTVNTAPDPCVSSGVDDSFEQNDDCASHSFITAGTHLGLFVARGDADFYRITVPIAQTLSIQTGYVLTNGELSTATYGDPTCTIIAGSAGWTGQDMLSFTNDTGASLDVFFSVQMPQFASTNCNSYDLVLTLSPDPCQTTPDDIFAPNQDCATATPAANGTFSGLYVDTIKSDFFTFDLIDGGSASIDLSFPTSGALVDLLLYDEDSVGCGNELAPVQAAYSDPFNGTTTMVVQNTSGASVTYYLQVDVWHATTPPTCNTYDIHFDLNGAPFGTSMCLGDGSEVVGGSSLACPCGNLSAPGAGEGCVNSTGVGARITGSGTNLYHRDDLVLGLVQARPNQPALLLQGETRTGFPFRDGLLCMGNPTERIEVVMLDASGSATTTASIQTEGNVPGPGAVRYYQFWYRDPVLTPCGSGTNFSVGLELEYL